MPHCYKIKATWCRVLKIFRLFLSDLRYFMRLGYYIKSFTAVCYKKRFFALRTAFTVRLIHRGYTLKA